MNVFKPEWRRVDDLITNAISGFCLDYIITLIPHSPEIQSFFKSFQTIVFQTQSLTTWNFSSCALRAFDRNTCFFDIAIS